MTRNQQAGSRGGRRRGSPGAVSRWVQRAYERPYERPYPATAIPAARPPGPLVTLVRRRAVAKVLSMSLPPNRPNPPKATDLLRRHYCRSGYRACTRCDQLKL
jgi:hypothetical protein